MSIGGFHTWNCCTDCSFLPKEIRYYVLCQYLYLRDMLQTVAALGFFIHSLVDCIHFAPSIEGLLSEYILHNIMKAVSLMISDEQCFTLAVKMMKI